MKEHFHNRILYLKDDIYFLQTDGTVEVDTCLYQCCEVFLKILLRASLDHGLMMARNVAIRFLLTRPSMNFGDMPFLSIQIRGILRL